MFGLFAYHVGARSRSTYALLAAAMHLIISVVVAGLIAVLVFGFWFPSSLKDLVGGVNLFWIIIIVDVICGPLLTLVIFNPNKPRAELRSDIALVAVIQLCALLYGIHTLAHARPVALVFEIDRFRVITYSDIVDEELPNVPDWAQPWSLADIRTVGLRATGTLEEKLSSIDASAQGVEPSQRPSRWQDYELSKKMVLDRARPLKALRDKYADQSEIIEAAIKSGQILRKSGDIHNNATILWLPVVSRRSNDWVVLIDRQDAQPLAYVHLNGFFEDRPNNIE